MTRSIAPTGWRSGAGRRDHEKLTAYLVTMLAEDLSAAPRPRSDSLSSDSRRWTSKTESS